MRATVMYGAGDVRVEHRPDPAIQNPTDAVVRVVAAGICGSDLHPFHSMPPTEQGRPMGHEFRVPQAQGTLVKLPVEPDSALLPSLLTLTDVFCTGHHSAVTAGVSARTTVTVIGDGAVGLCAVLAARRLGAQRVVLMGGNRDRTDLGREFGATDVVAERGDEGIARVKELTNGTGTHTVLECVGSLDGTIEPGRVFGRALGLDEVPDGYRAMADRQALKVFLTPWTPR